MTRKGNKGSKGSKLNVNGLTNGEWITAVGQVPVLDLHKLNKAF